MTNGVAAGPQNLVFLGPGFRRDDGGSPSPYALQL